MGGSGARRAADPGANFGWGCHPFRPPRPATDLATQVATGGVGQGAAGGGTGPDTRRSAGTI